MRARSSGRVETLDLVEVYFSVKQRRVCSLLRLEIMESEPTMRPSDRKLDVLRQAEASASERRQWIARNRFFHDEDVRYLKTLIPEDARVLELGCGTGDLLAALKPSFGVGVDFSPRMIDVARRSYPHLTFVVGDIETSHVVTSLPGPFDFIVVVDTFGALDDCQAMLESLHDICTRETRLIIGYFSHLWYPGLKLAELVRLKMPQPPQNVLSPADLGALVALSDFDPIKSDRRVLAPVSAVGIGRVVNRFIAPLPLICHLCLRHYTLCRSLRRAVSSVKSATVVVPARNERGTIEDAIKRIPHFTEDLEIIFVEGHSQDGTWEEIQRVVAAYPEHHIKCLRQPGKGKADAVFHAFDVAHGDVLMILDADLAVPPEQLSKFWDAIRTGKCEFANGSRFVYPQEKEAMRFLNLIANKIFSLLFTWLFSQRLTDTLCGTKALTRSDYERMKLDRSLIGVGSDPFGDFSLIFGVARLGLRSTDIPVRYASRRYGETQISRFRHGFLLFRLALQAFLRMKAI